jgi:hypothetical protein
MYFAASQGGLETGTNWNLVGTWCRESQGCATHAIPNNIPMFSGPPDSMAMKSATYGLRFQVEMHVVASKLEQHRTSWNLVQGCAINAIPNNIPMFSGPPDSIMMKSATYVIRHRVEMHMGGLEHGRKWNLVELGAEMCYQHDSKCYSYVFGAA